MNNTIYVVMVTSDMGHKEVIGYWTECPTNEEIEEYLKTKADLIYYSDYDNYGGPNFEVLYLNKLSLPSKFYTSR